MESAGVKLAASDIDPAAIMPVAGAAIAIPMNQHTDYACV